MKLRYRRELRQHARNLRTNMTDAEQALWVCLRRKQIYGLPFYRQKPLSSFIVDFYCPAARLVVELDGGQHFDTENRVKDIARDRALSRLGLKVLRFDNYQALRETEAVIEVIAHEVDSRRLGNANPP